MTAGMGAVAPHVSDSGQGRHLQQQASITTTIPTHCAACFVEWLCIILGLQTCSWRLHKSARAQILTVNPACTVACTWELVSHIACAWSTINTRLILLGYCVHNGPAAATAQAMHSVSEDVRPRQRCILIRCVYLMQYVAVLLYSLHAGMQLSCLAQECKAQALHQHPHSPMQNTTRTAFHMTC